MPKLRAVKDGENPQKRLTVTEAAALNDHREMLVALRDRIARSVEASSTNPVALAALTRQMVLISKELSVLDARARMMLLVWLRGLLMRLGTARSKAVRRGLAL